LHQALTARVRVSEKVTAAHLRERYHEYQATPRITTMINPTTGAPRTCEAHDTMAIERCQISCQTGAAVTIKVARAIAMTVMTEATLYMVRLSAVRGAC
jgi:hypothetical protein